MNRRRTIPERVLTVLAGALVLRALAGILGNYGDYFPPSFASAFLHGREAYFHGWYQWAFHVHIVSGPLVLAVGLFLVSDPARRLSPRWHRRLGWFQVGCVLLLTTPSGLWMATRAAAGPVAGVGLATLAVATAGSIALGAMAAVQRRFAAHRRWMWRCYLLLCSTIVLRLVGGLATALEWSPPWLDPLTSWACWLVPLAAFECRERWRRRENDLPPSRGKTDREAAR